MVDAVLLGPIYQLCKPESLYKRPVPRWTLIVIVLTLIHFQKPLASYNDEFGKRHSVTNSFICKVH